MAEITKRVLVLEFGTASGDSIKLTISKPNLGLEDAEIKAGMTAIIASNALGEEEKVSVMKSATYVTTESENIALS